MPRSRLAVLLLAIAVGLGGCSNKRQGPPPPSMTGPSGATSAATEPEAALPPVEPREAALASVVRHLLEERHLLQRTIDDKVARESVTALLERIDPGKMFLLAADAEALTAQAERVDDQLRAGRLDLGREVSRRFVDRVDAVAPMVAALLAQPLDHTDEEWVELDGDKLGFATSDDELRDRWRQRLELELLERTAPPLEQPKPGAKPLPPPAPLPEREAKARTALATTYAGRFARLRDYQVKDAQADLINAIASVIDPHSDYLPPADKANFDIRISGSLEGIGALLRERDHYVEVQELVPGGAAWRAGELEAGDLILGVSTDRRDPVDVADMRLDEVVKMIRGPKGSVVHLKVRKASGDEKTIDITRDVVEIEATYARGAVLEQKGLPPIGYVYLPGFYGGMGRDAASDVRKLVDRLTDRKVAGVILDMRGNGGGLLEDAVELTGLFIDQGPVVQVKGGDGDVQVLADDDAGMAYDGPVVVMVDRFSASAAEIVAAALQDYKRAVVVGTGPTHGKGTVQSLNSLDRVTGGQFELGSFKLTIQQFYRVNGWSTQLDGVAPDVVLPDPAAHIEAGERSLDHAIPASRIDPVPFKPWAPSWTPSSLSQKSAGRVAKEPLFGKLASSMKLLAARRDQTRLPLARPTFEARRKAQRDELEAAVPDLEKAPVRLKVVPLDPPPAPAPGERVDDRLARWQDQLSRDPWLAEAARVLDDASR